MASRPVKLVVRPRGKPIRNLPEETTLALLDSTADLYKRIAESSGTSVHRLRITKGSDGSLIPNSKGVTIDRTGLRDQSKIDVKDLGPQIAWRTVFIVEYLGPLLIHPLIYYLRSYIYRLPLLNQSPSSLQTLSLILISLHFLKREFETIFIHRFSLATMPVLNIFKNSAHYWLLAGLNIAYWTYSPSSPTAKPANPLLTYAGIALFAIGELLNLNTHVVLRNLRSSGGTERGIPHGLGFDWVTCPNYLFETMAWVGIWMVNRSWSTGFFAVVAVAQMAAWAKKKEKKYRSEFGDRYKRKRYAILPGIY
ncbi:hypothetical protein W97_07206 [Coniosporium apollinis CBS 100218]|uniref:very-long-chain enoyl-CoA reductase n=1 Tax=Coniosporium apollinis (strain CBS 100218) TaxID=1168221 RepID=R7Z1T5_CONA1|nr:uncharacterized protein W97_07206 [Coniosporium apollinis CBS 100218]EON68058.1 hypothetical protein W97_07206 [Coniosporium apollinis CBS 100218]